jgi:dipeptidyl aminopeptidase/acylaminoacyl peptidase
MSYGGYAVLCGLTFTPELYACGVDMFGPSSLITHLANLPPYQLNRRHHWDLRVGKLPRYAEGDKAGEVKSETEWTEEERAEVEFLRSRSPLYFADNVRAPLLIAQGANDSRVLQSESDQFVEALRARGVPVEYVVYENEGHGFYRPENRLDFYRRAEKFLAEHLGGRCEEQWALALNL